ncbi:hypothetical protein M409DRAFT_53947 [Zasmidium cellare ATCC 36951]|uniref:Uncharacterized protein n=1 Tax=Zasmidium cellare ATCC 36951 TaxID=1080233 RepID=A0A6A6CMF5_ZASCE|nr:uncharacterized protein M409DRAFT_53947 [Zasmidium cellare ATCC 36951]KAF2167340.1 hypothetical protein M409DRAFT_53947 [Zasmidium cellare ATCC 36951]
MNTIVHANARAHLLGFPAEIRNRIYEYALIEHNNINVPPTGMAQPGVLRACRSIRSEATKLYYANNKFNLAIQDYNGAAYVGFYKTIQLYDSSDTLASNIEMVFSGGPNWQNLLRWFEAAHAREIWSPLFDWDLNDATKELAAVATLFRTQVHTMGYLLWRGESGDTIMDNETWQQNPEEVIDVVDREGVKRRKGQVEM